MSNVRQHRLQPSRMKSLLLFAALVASSAVAETVVLPIPNEAWSIQFDGPSLKEVKSQSGPAGYAYAGNAGRVNVSLFVEAPSCAGGDSNAARYKCFTSQITKSPLVVRSSIAGNENANGVLVMYLVRTEVNGRPIQAFNAHLLFTQAGKEGDFHASVVQPEGEDVPSLVALVQSVRVRPK